jgi:hypothetical protein
MADEFPHLPGTDPLTLAGDLAAQKVTGLDLCLGRGLAHSLDGHAALQRRDSACGADRTGTSV